MITVEDLLSRLWMHESVFSLELVGLEKSFGQIFVNNNPGPKIFIHDAETIMGVLEQTLIKFPDYKLELLKAFQEINHAA